MEVQICFTMGLKWVPLSRHELICCFLCNSTREMGPRPPTFKRDSLISFVIALWFWIIDKVPKGGIFGDSSDSTVKNFDLPIPRLATSTRLFILAKLIFSWLNLHYVKYKCTDLKMTKLSRLYRTLVVILCACGANGFSLCTRISLDLGVAEFETLCDLDFCTCHDPYGRVRCVCPGEDPNEELIIRAIGSCSVPMGTTSISLDNCKKVSVIREGFEELRDLQNIHFLNVKHVSVEGKTFHSTGPPRTITFVNSTIPDITSFTFTGNIHSVLFDHCYVGVIRAFAFSSIDGAESITFKDTNVANVEVQSFKKFAMNKFLILESQFNVIPSRFVVDVSVDTVFKMESTFIDEVRTLGFKIFNPKKVILVDSMINKLHGEAFKIYSKGEIVINGNSFSNIDNEAFRGISVDSTVLKQIGKQKLKFRNQTVANLQTKSLYFNRSEFDVQITRLMVDETCTCDGLMLWVEMITIGKKPRESIEVELEAIWCHMDDKKEGNFDYVPGREFYKEHCNKLTSSIHFFVIIISATAICLTIMIAITVCVLRRRRKWQPVPVSQSNGHGGPRGKGKVQKKSKKPGGSREIVKPETTKAMIVPDGRTYKETEFHIIVEKAEPLDDECVSYAVVRDRSRSQMN